MEFKKINRPKHRTSIGGQALIEGVMMKGPDNYSMAVRKPNGEIELEVRPVESLGKKYSFFRLPFIRGVVALIEAMVLGTKALFYSADIAEEDLVEESTFIEKTFKDKADSVYMAISLTISIVLSIGLFMFLPTFVTNFFKEKVTSLILLNLIEGLIRLLIFFLYLIFISKTEDVKRVFEYHGAEHKTIHCYEADLDLNVDNVKRFSILHPRCGTSFIFMVMIISIIVLSFTGWPSPIKRLLIRLVMFPLIAGISYEVNRILGRSSGWLVAILSYPGLMIQKLATVREPDASQIKVAIAALEAVIPEDRQKDLW